jgi:hypothetical protein
LLQLLVDPCNTDHVLLQLWPPCFLFSDRTFGSPPTTPTPLLPPTDQPTLQTLSPRPVQAPHAPPKHCATRRQLAPHDLLLQLLVPHLLGPELKGLEQPTVPAQLLCGLMRLHVQGCPAALPICISNIHWSMCSQQLLCCGSVALPSAVLCGRWYQ